MMTRGHLALALILSVVAGGAGILVAKHTMKADATAVEGLLWPNPRTLGAFNAVDQDGQPFSNEDLRGRWSLLFFGFTHCPDICPITMTVLAQARAALAAAAGDTPLQVIFVSVDPVRDAPAQLAEYVRYFDPGFLGLGGTLDQVRALTSQMGVAFFHGPPGATGDYTVDHSASIFVIDPQVRMVGVISAPHQAESLVTRFRGMADFLRRAGS